MAQHQHSASSEPLAIQRVTPQQQGRLELTSPAIQPGGPIEDLYANYHDDLSPPLDWTAMPDAETFLLLLQDPDAPLDKPVLHWSVWNIPGTADSLPQGVRHGPTLPEFAGMTQGCNPRGEFGYMGPRPPSGHGPHRYHFQLFALDIRLTAPPTTPLEELINILKGHTIASAELIGTYECDPEAHLTAAHEPRSFAHQDPRGGLDADDVDRHAPHTEAGVIERGALGFLY